MKNKKINLFQNKLLWIIVVFAMIIIATFLLLMNFTNFYSTLTLKEDSLSSKLKDYHSQSGNFDILYPEQLVPGDTPQGNHGDLEVTAVITNFLSSPYIEVSKKVFSGGTMDNVLNWGIKRAQSQKGFQDIGYKQYSTSNYFGYTEEYSRSLENLWGKREFHCVDWYYLSETNKVGYDFSFCVDQQNWDKALNIFLTMIESIKFNP